MTRDEMEIKVWAGYSNRVWEDGSGAVAHRLHSQK